tara:strand:- start:197 stop:529 length:333 start_codon:yes stop_codon:yes gene_type:complete
MIENKNKVLFDNILDKDCPEEVFTEGFCDLIVYDDIVKLNLFSRPTHSKDHLNSKKILKTLTFTKSNFEKFVFALNSEYKNISEQLKNYSQKKPKENIENTKPKKGSRLL